MASIPGSLPFPVPDHSGKMFLVTGGNAGIGLETACQLVHQHAKVYIGCRSESKGQAAIANIKERVPDADIHMLLMDLMDLSSVVRAAKEFIQKEPRLDGLINNAGIMATPMAISQDGYEAQLQTNYLAHWLLTHHLLPLLLSTSRTLPPTSIRVVNITSMGHTYAPKGGIQFDDMNQLHGGPWTRYGMSKLANILHARELSRLYGPHSSSEAQGQGSIGTAACHPGNVDTSLSRNSAYLGKLAPMAAPFMKCLNIFISPAEAAATPVFAATSGDLVSGSYFVPVAKVGKESKEAKDGELATKLWAWTEGEMRGKGFVD